MSVEIKAGLESSVVHNHGVVSTRISPSRVVWRSLPSSLGVTTPTSMPVRFEKSAMKKKR